MPFSIAGLGSYLPPRAVGNAEVGALVGLDAGRIQQLFDIEERRWVRDTESGRPMPGQSVADLAANAVRAALADAGVASSEVDLLVAVSTTLEYISPPLDYRVRRKLGTGDILGFSLHSACTGLFRAATLVDALLATDRARVAVIVAADAMSQYFAFDPELPKDLRLSMALYGDGAGALVAVRPERTLPSTEGLHVVSTASSECPGIMFAGPFGAKSAHLLASEDEQRRVGYHDFRRVLDKGGRLTREASNVVLSSIGKTFDDVDHILTHQATGNLKGIAATLGMPADKLHVNIQRVGNTLSPSILLLFDELKRRQAFRPDDLLLLCSAESATWSYGGMAVRWPGVSEGTSYLERRGEA